MISRVLRTVLIGSLLVFTLSTCDMRDFGENDADLEVTIETVGELIDDQYLLILDGEDERVVAPNDVVQISGLAPGEHTLELTDVSANCIVTGGTERTVTLTPTRSTEVTYSVTCVDVGANIIFESDRGGSLDIYAIDFATGIIKPVITAPGPDYEPSVSPDGGWIYFTSRREGNLEIYRIRPDGTALSNLTHNPAADTEAAVSPDGTKVAFVSLRDGNAEIYVMDADGSNPTRVTERSVQDTQPAWLSPTEIVFTTSGPVPRLIVHDLISGNERPLTLDLGGASYPAVSPDFSRIAYATRIDGNLEIVVADADGQNPRRITDHPADDASPAFSPDGQRIAFASDRSGNTDIYLVNIDGTGLINLTPEGSFDFKPVFVPEQ